MSLVSKVRRAIKRTIHPDRPATGETDVPWFDRPDAAEILEIRRKAGRYSGDEYAMLRKWLDDGYFVISGLIPQADLDAMNRDVESLWTASTPRPGLKIHGFKLRDEDPLGDVPHERVLELDLARRIELRQQHRWRLHYFIAHSEPTRRVFHNPGLARWVEIIFDRKIGPTNSINFQFGSEQKLHQDMAVFSIDPVGWLIGIWIAAEDISPDSGPMVYCPGSHKDPMWEGFGNYPATFLKNCSKEQTTGYQTYLDKRAEDFSCHPFLGRKGDVLFWHGMLIHGGSPVRDPKSTRQSLVLHCIPPACNKESEAKGPFNW